MAETPEKPTSGQDKPKNLLMERELTKHAFPKNYVGFVDMLGFSALKSRATQRERRYRRTSTSCADGRRPAEPAAVNG